MKHIPLTQNRVALVDDSDYEYLMQWKWHCSHGHAMKCGKRFGKGKREPKISMSRLLLNALDSNILVDHKDHNTLNNCRDNLRYATYSNNNANRIPKNKYLGVTWHKNAWRAVITKNKKHIHIGRFRDEIDAAKAYDKRAIEIHGEFANLNFKTA